MNPGERIVPAQPTMCKVAARVQPARARARGTARRGAARCDAMRCGVTVRRRIPIGEQTDVKQDSLPLFSTFFFPPCLSFPPPFFLCKFQVYITLYIPWLMISGRIRSR